jgi:hypothetical protein
LDTQKLCYQSYRLHSCLFHLALPLGSFLAAHTLINAQPE